MTTNTTKTLSESIAQQLLSPPEVQKRVAATFSDSRNSSSSHEVTVMAVGIAVQLALSSIPGMDAVFAAQMITDLINPYNYNNTLSRSGLDGLSTGMIDSVVKALKSQLPSMIDSTYAQLKNTLITKDQVTQLLTIATNYWSIISDPQVQSSCYADYEQNKTLTGPPQSGCNQLYTEYYQQFYAANHDDYINQNYQASHDLFENLIGNNINIYRTDVFKVFGVGFLILMPIVLFIIYKLYVRRSFSG